MYLYLSRYYESVEIRGKIVGFVPPEVLGMSWCAILSFLRQTDKCTGMGIHNNLNWHSKSLKHLNI